MTTERDRKLEDLASVVRVAGYELGRSAQMSDATCETQTFARDRFRLALSRLLAAAKDTTP